MHSSNSETWLSLSAYVATDDLEKLRSRSKSISTMCTWESHKIVNTVAECTLKGIQKEAERHLTVQLHMCLRVSESQHKSLTHNNTNAVGRLHCKPLQYAACFWTRPMENSKQSMKSMKQALDQCNLAEQHDNLYKL